MKTKRGILVACAVVALGTFVSCATTGSSERACAATCKDRQACGALLLDALHKKDVDLIRCVSNERIDIGMETSDNAEAVPARTAIDAVLGGLTEFKWAQSSELGSWDGISVRSTDGERLGTFYLRKGKTGWRLGGFASENREVIQEIGRRIRASLK